MAKKATHLAVVDPIRRRASEKRIIDAAERRKKEEWEHQLTADQVMIRVKEIRAGLEVYNTVLAALPFEMPAPERYSLRDLDETESSAMAERLIPLIEYRYNKLQKHLYDTGEWDLADNVLGPMKWTLADAAYSIGVLAGAIFTGAPEKEIDRLERGLVYSASLRPDCL